MDTKTRSKNTSELDPCNFYPCISTPLPIRVKHHASLVYFPRIRFESIRPLEFEGKRHGRPGVDSSTFSPQASLAVSTKLACQKRAGSTKPFWCHPRLMAARIVPTGSHRLYLVLFPCASRRCSRCLDLIPVDQRLQKWYLHGRRSRITDAVLDCLSVDE